jgi:molybdopterin converting factor small subunit
MPNQTDSPGRAAVTVHVPAVLRGVAAGRSTIHVEQLVRDGRPTVGEVLAALRPIYPGIHFAVLDELGEVRPHVNVFAGDENIKLGAGLATPVPPGVEVWILAAVSGG